MTREMLGKYLEVVQELPMPGRKTNRYSIYSAQHGDYLGQVKWMGRWRQYAFYPATETIWNKECLADINNLIARLMDERKTK